MTVEQLCSALRDEVSKLMASRRDNPAATIGHACQILKLIERVSREHDRALFHAQTELEIERLVQERPANEC